MSTDVVLILGGVDKGNDYSMLKELVKQKVKAIVCLGKDNKRIHDAFEDDVESDCKHRIGSQRLAQDSISPG
jgi:UDP-N-acetylmuramoylalanine--D-glutamate ligase